MPHLPVKESKFYAGIDPGFTGAIAVIDAAGLHPQVWDMPITAKGRDRTRLPDLHGLREIFDTLAALPDLVLGIEWPTTRPGEGAERASRFGHGKGVLEAFAFLRRLDYYKIAPNLWKGRLGLPGKTTPTSAAVCSAYFDSAYPHHTRLIRGPRGGVKDGRMDALLIAHFLREQTGAVPRTPLRNLIPGSDEAARLVFGGGRKRKKTRP